MLPLRIITAFVVALTTAWLACTAYAAPSRSTAARSAGAAAPLNVHVVAHSHDDVGWRKTLAEYYFGSAQEIDNGAVVDILDSVIAALQADPQRKFIYVEQAFFSVWWNEQNPQMHETVRKLVQTGQLEVRAHTCELASAAEAIAVPDTASAPACHCACSL